jgi:hypothetical protein
MRRHGEPPELIRWRLCGTSKTRSYRYQAVRGNSTQLRIFSRRVGWLWRSVLVRRSQRARGAGIVRSHTPARRQSRGPPAISSQIRNRAPRGSICQEMPVRRRKTMPVRHARSETPGRPPFGRRGGIGKNSSTRSHNGSGSSTVAIPAHAISPKRSGFQMFYYTL